MAILLHERALRIEKDALGQHPTTHTVTAQTMSSMGASYGEQGQNKKAIELYEQALRIYERTVGRMHRHAWFTRDKCSYQHEGWSSTTTWTATTTPG